MNLKFFHRKPAKLTTKPADKPTDISTAVIAQVHHDLYPVVDQMQTQLSTTDAMVRQVKAFAQNYQWNSVAKEINDRLDTGILGAIKGWVGEATERGRHDRKMFDQLLKRWDDDRNGLLAIIEDQKKTMLTLETQIRNHLGSV